MEKLKEKIKKILKKRISREMYLKIRNFYRKIRYLKKDFLVFWKNMFPYDVELKLKYLYRKIKHKPYDIIEPYIVNPKWNNKYKKYYVLRISWPAMGPLAIARSMLRMYPALEKKGYIPLVEYGYFDDLKRGIHPEVNFWEELFIQDECVSELSRQEREIVFEGINQIKIEKWQSVFLKKMDGRKSGSRYRMFSGNEGKEYYQKWNSVAGKCLKLNPRITQIEDRLGYLLGNEGETVAVIYTASFSKAYYSKVPKKHQKILDTHPLVPDVDQIFEMLDDYLKDKTFKYIFICCEASEIIEKFERKYKEKLVYIKRKSYMDENPSIYHGGMTMSQEEIKKTCGKEMLLAQFVPYLQEIYIASRCKFLFGSVCSALVMALIWNGGCYKDIFIVPDENPNSCAYFEK